MENVGRESVSDVTLGRLESITDRLDKTAGEVEGRLERFMSPSTPDGSGAKEAAVESMPEYFSKMDSLINRLRLADRTLRSCLDRLAI